MVEEAEAAQLAAEQPRVVFSPGVEASKKSATEVSQSRNVKPSITLQPSQDGCIEDWDGVESA